MKKLKTLLLFTCLLLPAMEISAQRQRRGTRSASPKAAASAPTTASSPAPSAVSTTPMLLATLNGQNITTADIDPKVRQEIEQLDEKIAESRRQILETEINTLLLASEAGKRRITPQQLYDIEVAKKIGEPPAAEVNRFIEENRDQVDQLEPSKMRQQVVAYLRGAREAEMSEQLVKKLRATTPVILRADLNSSSLSPSTVVATVGRVPVTAGPILERLKPVIYKLRMSSYLLQREAVDRTINDLLLLAEANRLTVPPEEIVRKEITDKLKPPTEADVEKFYSENKTNLNGELSSLRTQIGEYLHERERQRLERELSERLRKSANIRFVISEPAQPVQAISVDDDPTQGTANAPVTIVEFTDFQCPSCAAMHPVLDGVLKSYGNKIRLVVRDFPLAMHANARKAAEAANAAHAQGKFFEYIALLFKRQNALDVPSLKKYATEIGLDRTKFDAALDSGKYAVEVRKDVAEGELYGVESTPTIFVNGVALRILSDEALRAAIDRALNSSAPKSPSD